MPLSNWRDAADRIRCLLQNNINMKELLRKISNWYFSRKALPYWCILVMDCMAVYDKDSLCITSSMEVWSWHNTSGKSPLVSACVS